MPRVPSTGILCDNCWHTIRRSSPGQRRTQQVDAQMRGERTELRPVPSDSMALSAVWGSMAEAQQERVRRIVAQVCRERLDEERCDEPA